MALPVGKPYTDELQKEILTFLWTRQHEGQTEQKRRLVAKTCIGAGLEMGGLGIQSIENTVQGFQQNPVQKVYKKANQPVTDSLLPRILNGLLRRINRPTIQDHVERLGPEQWTVTAAQLHSRNAMFAEAFRAVAMLLVLYEVDKDGWHHAAIVGHTKSSKLFPFTRADAMLLQEWDVIVVSQLFGTNELTGMLNRAENTVVTNRLWQYPLLRHKPQLLRAQLCNNSFVDKTSVAVTTLALLFQKDQNISQKFKKVIRHNLHLSMKIPPAFSTQERDGCMSLNGKLLKMPFVSLPFMSSKTRETAFQILNRTIWTNNKGFKSGLCISPQCFRCDEIETMEHMLYLCPNYAEKIWTEFGHLLTRTITQFSNEYTAQIELTPKEIIFNKPHPAILLRIPDTLVCHSILVLVQEIKRDIIFRRMQLQEPMHQEVLRIRIHAHLLSSIRKLTSLLEYQGVVQNNVPISFLKVLTDTTVQAVSEL
jgi:hypothetical protein